jgi:hypothetical protein
VNETRGPLGLHRWLAEIGAFPFGMIAATNSPQPFE